MARISSHRWASKTLELACTLLLLPGMAGCKRPAAATVATESSLIAADGFRRRGAIAIEREYVVTSLDVVRLGKTVNLHSVATHGSLLGGVKKRDENLGLALAHVLSAGLSAPALGDSGALDEGAELVALSLDDEGGSSIVTGTVKGWRPHDGRAYLETDLHMPESSKAIGVLGADASLVGIFAFSLTEKLNYVLPIEYVIADGLGMANHIVSQTPSQGFLAHHQQAAATSGMLQKPFDFETMECEASFSSTALMGTVSMLEEPQSPAHSKPVAFKLTTAGEPDKRRVLGEGVLEQRFVQWKADPETGQEVAAELRDAFGDAYAQESFDRYEYGTLRFRLPLAPLCPSITSEDDHILTLTLSDGRVSEPMDYGYLSDVCAGREEGHGDDWERDWGMTADRSEKTAMARLRSKMKRRGSTRRKRKGNRRSKKKHRRRGRGRR